MSLIKVAIADDHKIFRKGVILSLRPYANIKFVMEAENGQELIDNLPGEEIPEVILMDIDMPGITGIEAVKQVRLFNQQVQIIMLTVFDDNQHVLDAICAGASGYLLKKNISDHLPEAISQVLQGEAPMSRGIARMIIQSMQESVKPVANNYNLTQREKEILTHLSKGNSYKMIAADLFISIDTVRTHIKKIYEKLQVHSQGEAISKAVNERLV